MRLPFNSMGRIRTKVVQEPFPNSAWLGEVRVHVAPVCTRSNEGLEED